MLLWNSGFGCLVLYNKLLVHQFPYVPLDAYVVGKRYIQRRGGYRSWGLSKYYVNLKFIDNQETFRLDDSKVFKKINQGDSVCVIFAKGLYGINIIKDISPKNK